MSTGAISILTSQSPFSGGLLNHRNITRSQSSLTAANVAFLWRLQNFHNFDIFFKYTSNRTVTLCKKNSSKFIVNACIGGGFLTVGYSI